MRVGAGRADITPSYDVELSGYVKREQPALGVADRIIVRVAVFEAGEGRVAVVSLDLLELPRDLADELRTIAASVIGVAPESVCVACTHTHSAPAVYPLYKCGELSAPFVAQLRGHLRHAAEAAMRTLRPARLGWQHAPLRLSANRRGAQRADQGGPTGIEPADDTLRCLAAFDESDRSVCLLLNYACHPVCLDHTNRSISGDFPGAACNELERQLGGDAVVMFLNGCAGDLNPFDEYRGTPGAMKRAADRVVQSATGMLPEARQRATDDQNHVSAIYNIVRLNYAPVDEIPWLQRLEGLAPGPKRHFVLHFLEQHRAGAYPLFMPVAVQILRIGPLRMSAMSGEIFFELGRQIQIAARDENLWLVGYANGGQGYIPTRAAHHEGGYEPNSSNWYYLRPPLAPGTGEQLADAVVHLLK